MNRLQLFNLLLTATAVTTALTAGLFFAWSCSVIPGLARLPDAGYIAAMQAMNKAILNPLFFCVFMGALVLLPLTAVCCYGHPLTLRWWLLATAAVLYGVGVFGLTMSGNVPLNESLDAFQLSSATTEEILARRLAFEGAWNKLHTIRAVVSVITLVLVIRACMTMQALT